jgi:hypothetical protein
MTSFREPEVTNADEGSCRAREHPGSNVDLSRAVEFPPLDVPPIPAPYGTVAAFYDLIVSISRLPA